MKNVNAFVLAIHQHLCLILFLILQLFQMMITALSLLIKMLESERRIWPDHPNVANEYVHDCDLVGPSVVELNPDPSPQSLH